MMWFSFWRSRNRFSLEELRYLTEQLQKIQIVNEVNKDFVIEALRSIAELVTYGDQHDSTFFDFFMEKQVLGEFIRILKISRTVTVSLQLLQTMSIMIQNLKNEHAIYYLFSNEHINYLITYSFDFRNEELLSYYISFLRAISGHLNKSTIALLVKTQNDEVVSFPLYVEAIQYAFHEESMIRIAIRALTLNVYHVGDESVNRYVASGTLANYFTDLVAFFKKQCLRLNDLVVQASQETSKDFSSSIIAFADEIEDNLYYFSDVISAGIPDVDKLITDNLLRLLILPLLLPSLIEAGVGIGAVTSLYLLCCILRIVKIKDLANTIVAAFFCPQGAFVSLPEAKMNGAAISYKLQHLKTEESAQSSNGYVAEDEGNLKLSIPDDVSLQDSCGDPNQSLRETVLSYLNVGNDVQVLGSLSVVATLSQTKELEESMLDAFGILPKRKQHKKLLLQALVGESSGEEQLFSSGSNSTRFGFVSELDSYLQKLKEYGVSTSFEPRSSPRSCRSQVLDALVNLFCRSDISAGTLWHGGWLLRQLLPYSEAEFNLQHLKLLRESFVKSSSNILLEARGTWADLLISVLCDEWRKCKKVTESSSPRNELRCMLLPSSSGGVISSESLAAGERMYEVVQAFVLLYQLQVFSQGIPLPDYAPIFPPVDIPQNSRGRAMGLDTVGPKQGVELKLVDAIPCRIAFERGKERYVWFQAVSMGTSGWIVLVEELPLKQNVGVVRVVAPLAACNPRIDDKHPRWLHLRIRPPTLQSLNPSKTAALGKAKARTLVDGRWTLAFRDEESCKSAVSMIHEEFNLLSQEVERQLKPLFDSDYSTLPRDSSLHPESPNTDPTNRL
ncbi:protein CLEC16A homolog isoform X1 [Chenopodium quinoa]|uniref:FPL domain-containing protein n=1 Tax=Chenopodium quinoa TaxID=63459 RepID=A0A803MKD5_CHEQI|nr:protein CLEC16A homolog isoform X1 [Chenopodium quinoa]